MEVSDWLLLAQTVVLLITAAAVIWYTVETHKIRKETSNQNSMLAEQLRIQLETHELTMQEQMSFIEPVFRWTDTNNNDSYEFINKGSKATINSIVAKRGFDVMIKPMGVIDSDEIGYVILDIRKLRPNLPRKCEFEIHYENKLGEKKSQTHYFDTSEGVMKRQDQK